MKKRRNRKPSPAPRPVADELLRDVVGGTDATEPEPPPRPGIGTSPG